MADITKDTYQSFLQSVLEKVPEDRRAAVQAAFEDQSVAPVLRESVLARTDYSRQTQDFQKEVQTARDQINEWQDWYTNEVAQAAQRQTELDQYKSLYGDLDEAGNEREKPTMDLKDLRTQFVTPEVMVQRDQMAMQFADILTDLKLDHKDRFGSRLDASALMEMAQRQGVPIREAYRQLTEPLERTKAEEALQTAIARAREEGRQQALTDHKLPISPPRREPHYVDNTQRVADPKMRVQNAVAAFNAGMASR